MIVVPSISTACKSRKQNRVRKSGLSDRSPATSRIIESLLEWFATAARDLPWRRTSDPYAIWVSEIMLQQTQVKTVIPYWERWMRSLPNVRALAEADSATIHKLWEGLGYYTRVRNMQKAAQRIRDVHGGNFPREFEDVLALPGIGRYTAGAVCSIAFNQPAPILDGNVMRVLTRVFAIKTDPRSNPTNEYLWSLAAELVGEAKRRESDGLARTASSLNQSLMELGALVCTPRTPRCGECPLKDCCEAFRLGVVHRIPHLAKRVVPTSRWFAAFVVRRENHVLVRQRPAGVVNAHLWEFPNVELTGPGEEPRAASKRVFGSMPTRLVSLCTIRHSITRYRMTLHAFEIEVPWPRGEEVGVWIPIAALQTLAFNSAHRRIAAALLQRWGA